MVTYYYIYRVAFDYLNIGLGAAGSYVMTIVIVALALVYYKVLGGSKDE
jgi:ABC-type sugar transport system permease subunit